MQQGCHLGPFCYSGGSLKILKEFRTNLSVSGARAVSFFNAIMGTLWAALAAEEDTEEEGNILYL